MSSKKDKNQYSNRILKILAEKPAVSVAELNEKIKSTSPLSPLHLHKMERGGCEADGVRGKNYAITRSIKGLKDAGLIEQINSPQNVYARLTKEGKKKVHSLELEKDNTLVNTSWDGLWRIILLDLPENRKAERESLRYLLKKAGFVCLKNSAWISPFPFEHLFLNIKKDLDLTTEMMIIVTEYIDEESKKVLFKAFGN